MNQNENMVDSALVIDELLKKLTSANYELAVKEALIIQLKSKVDALQEYIKQANEQVQVPVEEQ